MMEDQFFPFDLDAWEFRFRVIVRHLLSGWREAQAASREALISVRHTKVVVRFWLPMPLLYVTSEFTVWRTIAFARQLVLIFSAS